MFLHEPRSRKDLIGHWLRGLKEAWNWHIYTMTKHNQITDNNKEV